MSDEGRLVAGRYRLIDRIGRGGMGTVWRAEDEVLSRQVALKRLHVQPHLSDDELATLYERTRREARSAARIAHSNVVVVHDVVDDQGLPCIVMEYVPSTTLDALLKTGEVLPPAEAARIGLGMIAALRAAHTAGVLHRDVKPGNVLLGAGGRVVLTDFGIAMTSGTSTLTKTGEIVGSIDYIAPERMKGRNSGPAADLWALGATLYQSVEGRPPFRKDTAVETAYAIVVDPLAPLKQAGALEPLIEALLAKDPAERPSMEETERVLRAVASEAPTQLQTQPLSQPRPQPAPTRSLPARPSDPTRVDNDGGGRRKGDDNDGSGRRKDKGKGGRRKRRGPLLGAVAVTVVGAAVAGGLYMAAHRDSGSRTHGTEAAPTPASASVPKGFHLVEDKTLGASYPVPDGWKRGTSSFEQVKYTDPSRLVELTIGTVDPAGPNPESHFKNIEANTKRNYSTYRRIRMERTTFQGKAAAIWEFTFKGRVRAFRAIDLGFGQEGGKEYDIYVSAPEAQWDKYRPVFDTVKAGFRTD
ncbi:serine/threonine protein kinase [Streptomyces albiflavescens]|uniref:non-specific serine/threonine protein kinase n=1 Tax=Streptomyces albiflavescens TaxID=1623582 RepID=A0A918D4S2_9ACTN|nr:serine/threonine-protein kinase [Streptomyces albiflavescens]GGN65513.1 serine/threonine protein kinase [Streptomyces albiflavescens]